MRKITLSRPTHNFRLRVWCHSRARFGRADQEASISPSHRTVENGNFWVSMHQLRSNVPCLFLLLRQMPQTPQTSPSIQRANLSAQIIICMAWPADTFMHTYLYVILCCNDNYLELFLPSPSIVLLGSYRFAPCSMPLYSVVCELAHSVAIITITATIIFTTATTIATESICRLFRGNFRPSLDSRPPVWTERIFHIVH